MPAPPSGATAAGRSLIGTALEVNREVFVTSAVTTAVTSAGDRTGRADKIPFPRPTVP